jgi:hypothetical protein
MLKALVLPSVLYLVTVRSGAVRVWSKHRFLLCSAYTDIKLDLTGTFYLCDLSIFKDLPSFMSHVLLNDKQMLSIPSMHYTC